MNTKKLQTRMNELFVLSTSLPKVARARIAAAIYHKNKLISVGTNKLIEDSLQFKFKRNDKAIYLHAEIDAIKRACKLLTFSQLTECDMLIARSIIKSGNYEIALARPCVGCARAIYYFGIRHVYYTTNEHTIERFV